MEDLKFFLNILLMLSGEGDQKPEHHFSRSGAQVLLPGCSGSPSSRCSWFHDKRHLFDGFPGEQHPEAPRVRLDSNCSLVIANVSAQDAGSYSCMASGQLTRMFLGVMTLSPVRSGERLVLECSMNTSRCEPDSLRWFRDASVLQGDWTASQSECVSRLNMTLRQEDGRKFTCRFFDGQEVLMEADYTLYPRDHHNNMIIFFCRVAVVLLLPVVMATVLILGRRRVALVEQHELSPLD